jgi:alpha-L-glutamate ligase-like protein
MNRRNAACIAPWNRRANYPRVDDKELTKELCKSRGIPVPETFAVIRRHGDVRRFLEVTDAHREFVIKPAGGAEGRGIIVIVRHDHAEFLTISEEKLTAADLRYHLAAILSGLYSLGGQPGSAIIEQRIIPHPAFAKIAVGGTPDLRIVLYRGVPVMAMVRLPTRASRGRANLHQGAVAAGVHLRTGQTFGGVSGNRAVSVHPDTGEPIAAVQIPAWNDLLQASMHLADAVELGYLGVDFAWDRDLGPLVLEANARPGLAIQIANRTGLRPRLDAVDRVAPESLDPDARTELAGILADVSKAAPRPHAPIDSLLQFS